jgi:hypothetical protein
VYPRFSVWPFLKLILIFFIISNLFKPVLAIDKPDNGNHKYLEYRSRDKWALDYFKLNPTKFMTMVNKVYKLLLNNIIWLWDMVDRLCGLVVRVSSYRSRGPGFDFRPYQIFWELGGWNGVHSASWGQLRSYLNEKVAAPV